MNSHLQCRLAKSRDGARLLCGVLMSLVMLASSVIHGEDWPMWRYDASRSAASSETLPTGEMKLLWTRKFEGRRQAWDDPLNLDLMSYDRVLEPIVSNGRLMVGLNDRDKLACFDAATGEEQWSYFAEGPVRLPPAAAAGLVYFSSDDGYLYCVNINDGTLAWRFRGAPSALHAIGNGRLTSAWPARGGPVIRDDTVYFTASIWPFMGTFLYALNVNDGKIQWINDGTGSQFIKQPHSAPSFAGVAPQGALVATKDALIVPGGRSVPAVFNRSTGEFRYYEINAGGKGTGGSFVVANDHHFFVHTRSKGTRAFRVKDGVKTAFMPDEPVLMGEMVYAAGSDDRAKTPLVQAFDAAKGADAPKKIWQIQADASGDLVAAGRHLIAGGAKSITAIRLPDSARQSPQIEWSVPVAEPVARLLVADGKVFAVSEGGQISAYGVPKAGQRPTHFERPPAQSVDVAAKSRDVAKELLAAGDAEGYALWYGSAASPVAEAMAVESPFTQLAIIDADEASVARLRQRLDQAHRYGPVTVHVASPGSFKAPNYVANYVFVADGDSASSDPKLLAAIYESVRPYGGRLCLLSADARERQLIASAVKAMDLEQAEIQTTSQAVVVRRVGELPGAADWTHQHGDVANTIKSNDQRVKLPLGILWFGGSSNMDVLPRHGHGPPEQVIGGRLFIEGVDRLSARDVYTGRVLWKRTFKDLGVFDVYYDATYKDTPLNTSYNQVHIPGANGRGTNFVATEDRLYLLEGDRCLVLDPRSGKTLTEIVLPPDENGEAKEWGYIGIYKDVLIGGLGFANYQKRRSLTFPEDAKLKGNRSGFGAKSLDRAASIGLVGFDRHTGKQLWTIKAKHSFWHNGIVAGDGKVFCLDRNPKKVEEAMRRRGIPNPDSYRVLAIDYLTGQTRWEIEKDVFGSWLGYSTQHGLLLQAGAAASDRLSDEVGAGMAVYSGAEGELVWRNDGVKYAGPCILHNDWIITNANSYAESAGAFHIKTGEQKLVPNPITGELKPWKIKRAYGCNNIIASEHMLTFRSGAAGFYDLLGDSGTGNLGGFKSGCTANLVVANGVLNAPDYTRTCSCAYQNQTSLALVHMPEMDLWTVHPTAAATEQTDSIERIAINFGAPGDRRDSQGSLWLEYPIVGGDSPNLDVRADGASYFRRHSSSMANSIGPHGFEGASLPWVYASGAIGMKDVRIRVGVAAAAKPADGITLSHPDDDAEENANGDVALSSTDLEMVQESTKQTVGIRFAAVDLPRDAEIKNAHIQFTCDETTDVATTLIIGAEDAGNALRFESESHNVSRRSQVRAEVGWSPPPWKKKGEAAAAQRTPDLAPLLRQIIRREDWSPGNAMAFVITGDGKRIAVAGGKDSTKGPRLVINTTKGYVTAAPPPSDGEKPYRVRLFFALPPGIARQASHFDVIVQDKHRINGVAIQEGQAVAHTVPQVLIANELTIRFETKQGDAVLSGVEIVRLDDPR